VNCKIDISFAVVQGRCYGNQLFWAIFADVKIDRVYSLLSCSETKCTIILRRHALIAPLIAQNFVKMVKIGSAVFELKWGRK